MGQRTAKDQILETLRPGSMEHTEALACLALRGALWPYALFLIRGLSNQDVSLERHQYRRATWARPLGRLCRAPWCREYFSHQVTQMLPAKFYDASFGYS